MIGAIIGDMVGSRFERTQKAPADGFELFTERSQFTDDTVLTFAIAESMLYNIPYATAVKSYGRKYPLAGYGGRFKIWLAKTGYEPYNSWGNGSAMRVSPIGFAFDSLDEVLAEAEKSAEITHNHPEGIKGAQAIALAIFLAKTGVSKATIKREITSRFDYDLNRTIEQIKPTYTFDVSCAGSVPEAIIAFLESTDYESAIRKAISIGGDTDTIACMAGGIAEAFYKKIPEWMIVEMRKRLDEALLAILDAFSLKLKS